MKLSASVVDGGSFVLPYDYQAMETLSRTGFQVRFFGSRTEYNGNYLSAMTELPNTRITARNISSSVAHGRLSALLEYARLLVTLCRGYRRVDVIIFQFAPAWPLDLIVVALLRRKIAFVVHNAVPHDSAKARHWPYGLIARLAKETWFVSDATRHAFQKAWSIPERRIRVVPHGRIGLSPNAPRRDFALPETFETLAFWGTVKPYKGVDRLLDLCRNRDDRIGARLEIHGKWDAHLHPLKAEFIASGARVEDRFLSEVELERLLARDILFLLPYRSSSQSGVLYTLLHHGCPFLASDVGDFGQFLRRHGLQSLLVDDFLPDTLEKKIAWLSAHRAEVASQLQLAADELNWAPFAAAARDFVLE